MVTEGLNGLLEGTGIEAVTFPYATGPRNQPARDWLARFTGTTLGEAGTVTVGWSVQERRRALLATPVDYDWSR